MTHILVHEAFYEPRELHRLRQALDGEPAIRAIGRLPSTAGTVAVYRGPQP